MPISNSRPFIYRPSPISCNRWHTSKIPAIKLNRNPNLFRLFRYLSLKILNLFKRPMTFSFKARSEEIFWFVRFSSFVRGLPLDRFFGSRLLLWSFCIPVYPESTIPWIFRVQRTLLSLNSLKSCFLPLQKFVHIIKLDCLSTTTWLFKVCLFFFPE